MVDGLYIHHIDVYGNIIAIFSVNDELAFDLLMIYPLGNTIVHYDRIVMMEVYKSFQELDLNNLVDL